MYNPNRTYSVLFAFILGSVLMGRSSAIAADASAKAPSERWENDIRAFEAQDAASPPPKGALLFIGSSSIRLWKTLAEDFPEQPVINRGFGGSDIEDSVYFADRIVLPHEPRMIVMFAGSNDINRGKTPQRVLSDFQDFVSTVRAKLPETRIAFISISPNPARWSQVDRVRSANELIAEYIRKDSKLSFIDVFSRMLGSDGLPLPDIYAEDKLHMNAKGYAIWRRLVRSYLQ